MTEHSQDLPSVRAADTTVSKSTRVASSELFRGGREIVIVHHGREYRLFITKADKLILTK